MIDSHSVAVKLPTPDPLLTPSVQEESPPEETSTQQEESHQEESHVDSVVPQESEVSPPGGPDVCTTTTIVNGAGNATRNKKKKSSSYRRRQRKSTQKQEASFTRLAAILGQIKEACTGEDIVNKVGPLVEAATSIIETLSSKASVSLPPSTTSPTDALVAHKAPSEGTENTLPTSAAASPIKFTGMHQWKNTTGMLPIVRPGQRIPPQVYLGTRAPGFRAIPPPSATRPNNRLPISPIRLAPAKPLPDDVQQQLLRENTLAALRGKLRTATCKADCEAVIRELEVHQAEYELSAAKTRLSQFAH